MTFDKFLSSIGIEYKMGKSGNITIDYSSIGRAKFDMNLLRGKSADISYIKNFNTLMNRVAQYNRRVLTSEYNKLANKSSSVGKIEFFKKEVELANKRGNLLRTKSATISSKIEALKQTETRIGKRVIEVKGNKKVVRKQSLSSRGEERYLISNLAILTNATQMSEDEIKYVDEVLQPLGINFTDRLFNVISRDGSPQISTEIANVEEDIRSSDVFLELHKQEKMTDSEKDMMNDIRKAMQILETKGVTRSFQSMKRTRKRAKKFGSRKKRYFDD